MHHAALVAAYFLSFTGTVCGLQAKILTAAYTKAFKAGNDAKTANLIAAIAYYQEFTTRATTNSNPNISLEPSSCIREAEEYARNAAAMIAFFEKAVPVRS